MRYKLDGALDAGAAPDVRGFDSPDGCRDPECPMELGGSARLADETISMSTSTKTAAPKFHPRKIALIAHDHKKQDLLEWARFNRETLAKHALFATGTTGRVLSEELGLKVTRLQSGPIGGDQQIGAMIVDGAVDFLIFFWDPLAPQPHDPDVKALLRLAVVWNIPAACNRATADYMISSPLMASDYERLIPKFDSYLKRSVPLEAEAALEPPKPAAS